MNKNNQYGFLFDLDGTLINNMEYHHYSWQKMLHSLGYPWTLEEVKERVWGKNQEIFRRLFGDKYSDLEIESLCEQKEKHYVELYQDKIAFIQGFENFIAEAKDYNIRLAIVTAAPPLCVDFAKSALNLESYFELILDSEMVTKSKPDPEPYLKAAEIFKLPPKNCLVFEDAPVGVTSAENAGMSSIVLETSHKLEEFSKFNNIKKMIPDYTKITIKDCLNYL